ncbi:Putative membrane protein MJ1562 [Durusdinium trenchii]|uniref:Membrane protein MJ1562 n=1 Tax=Durusdinium trenchii TaxID=1381693 RepID=A0ABP0RD42_9DINO
MAHADRWTAVTEEPTLSRTDRLARWLVAWQVPALIVAALLALAAIPSSLQLQLDESIESFFADSDPHLIAYRRSKETFGGDEFVMVGYESADPFSPDHLDELEEFSQALSAVPGIRSESTQDLADTLRNDRAEGLLRLALRLPTTQTMLIRLSERVLVGDSKEPDENGAEPPRTVAVVMRLEPESEATVPRTETFSRIRDLAAAHDPPAYVAGEPVQVHDMFRYVEEDGWILGMASSLLLMVVILILFRSLRWVALPLLVVHVTLVWTRASLYLSGLKLSMVSSMLTSLVTIIGIATVMHVTVNYRQFRADFDRTTSFRETFIRLASAIAWTCVTTAIGFLSLLTSDITPVRSFGIMMAMGTLFVPVSALLLLPGGMLVGRFDTDPHAAPGEGFLIALLRNFSAWATGRSRVVFLTVAALAAFAIAGLFRLTVETDFSKNFRASSPIVQALVYFETHLGGVGSWEVAFDAPPTLDEAFLDEVRDLADELRELTLPDGTQLTKVVALTDGLDLVPKVPVSKGGGGLFRRLTQLRTPTLEERVELLNQLQPEMQPSLYNPERRRMRIMLRSLEQQPAEVKLRLISEVEKAAHQHFPEARATGLYVLLANLISSLLNDQLKSFIVAGLGIAITIAIAFRRLGLGLWMLVPNVLPILLVIGGMGWLGIPVNIGSAMIASVSMGLTIDSSIHYITAYRRLRSEGRTHEQAVEETHGDVGRALVFANIALIAGFTVLAMSHFIPLVYFGVLVSVAMFGGLLGNLLLLPTLLRNEETDGPQTAAPSPYLKNV